MIDFEDLAAPFPVDKVSWRVGSTNKNAERKRAGDQKAHATKGIALAYIDARDVMGRLDEVCGPAGWQDKYSHAGQRVICDLGIRLNDEWVWKANGAGSTQIEADKGAISDAFKRAGVMWGIGQYLYGLENSWVDLAPYGRIKDDQYSILNARLKKVSNNVIWGTPGERATLKAYLHLVRNQCMCADDIRIFKDNNEGMYSQFRKAARQKLDEAMQTIIDNDPTKLTA